MNKAILNEIKSVLQSIFYNHDLHLKRVLHCENIRLTFEVLDTTDEINTHELLFYRKAFDSINHKYISANDSTRSVWVKCNFQENIEYLDTVSVRTSNRHFYSSLLIYQKM